MTTSTPTTTLTLANLPALKAPLEGGSFAGITTRKDGTHCAVIRLPGAATKKNWKAAMAWAAKEGGELPTRPVAALLYANLKDELPPTWHWTCEEEKDDDEEDASYAWFCTFFSGYQSISHKSYEGGAVCVRLIPITA